MISTGDLRKGIAIELDGELWQILDYHHIKMGRGSAQVRIKLRNVKRGQTVERSFQAGEKWPRAILEKRPVQFLYRDGDDFHFMENESYEQFHLTAEQPRRHPVPGAVRSASRVFRANPLGRLRSGRGTRPPARGIRVRRRAEYIQDGRNDPPGRRDGGARDPRHRVPGPDAAPSRCTATWR